MRRTWLVLLMALSLACCLASPVLYFLGVLGGTAFKLILGLASLGWFVSATLWTGSRKHPR